MVVPNSSLDHTYIRALLDFTAHTKNRSHLIRVAPGPTSRGREQRVTKQSCPIDHNHQLRSRLEEKGARITLSLSLNLNRKLEQHHRTRMEQQRITLGKSITLVINLLRVRLLTLIFP